jgi:uncharacterized membrane protein
MRAKGGMLMKSLPTEKIAKVLTHLVDITLVCNIAALLAAPLLVFSRFSAENAAALKRAAVCGFMISGAALVRLVFSICYYASWRPLATYNALFVPMFAMAGLLALIMSALFRQAAEMKAENDLTI